MEVDRRITWLVALAVMLVSGCTSQQLCNNTINQMATVHELQQQQVLDNLAMFVCNRDSYPYFSVVVSGVCSLSDSGTLAVPNGFARSGLSFLYSSLGINPSVTRNLQENWQINPVNDSLKLTLMRCVYQRAVAGCFGLGESADCPNCQALYDAFYGALQPPVVTAISPPPNQQGKVFIDEGKTVILWGLHLQGSVVLMDGVPVTVDPSSDASHIQFKAPAHAAGDANVTVIRNTGQCPLPKTFAYLHGGPVAAAGTASTGGGAPAGAPHSIGMITPHCLTYSSNWFCWGQKHHIPKGCPCKLIGHYCDTYVWVPPCGVDELTKLTIVIQDIAYYDFSNTTVLGSYAGSPQGAGPGGRAVSPQFPPLLYEGTTLRNFTPPAQVSPPAGQ